MTAARDQPHAIAVALDPQSVPVVLDLVEPIRAAGDFGAACRNAKLKRLEHAPEIGARGGFFDISRRSIWNSRPFRCLVLHAELKRMAGMANNDFLLHPDRWHERAVETRAMACNSAAQDRKRLLKVYERLAARAEEWKMVRERSQQT
jgi:hypothetical protein